jgi:hypothetical protein
MSDLPPMDPNTDEASIEQLRRARVQGEAYGRALDHMVEDVADGGDELRSGDYLIGYAIEDAEGLYWLEGGELVWNEPEEENTHIEITVRDASDGRFIPGLDVEVTLVDDTGEEIGTEWHQFVWHPMLYHYARNWHVPADGVYKLKVDFEAPDFGRHDKVNGRRFAEGGHVEFEKVEISPGS